MFNLIVLGKNKKGGVGLKKKADFFKALGDENRLRIVQMLAEKDMCVCEIIEKLNVSQPAVSHHLKTLKQVGIVEDRREGKWIFYSLSQQEVMSQIDLLEGLVRKDDSIRKNIDCSYCERLRSQMGLQFEE